MSNIWWHMTATTKPDKFRQHVRVIHLIEIRKS